MRMSRTREVESDEKKSSSEPSEDEEDLLLSTESSPGTSEDSDACLSDLMRPDADVSEEEREVLILMKMNKNVSLVSQRLETLAAKVGKEKWLVENVKRSKENRKIEADSCIFSEKGNKIFKYSSDLLGDTQVSTCENEDERKRLTLANFKDELKSNVEGSTDEEEASKAVEEILNTTPSEGSSASSEVAASDSSSSSPEEKVGLLPSPSSPSRKPVPEELINHMQCPPWRKRALHRKIYCAEDILKQVTEKLGGLSVE